MNHQLVCVRVRALNTLVSGGETIDPNIAPPIKLSAPSAACKGSAISLHFLVATMTSVTRCQTTRSTPL